MNLNSILEKRVMEYLDTIGADYDITMPLSELLEIVRRSNSSNPDSAVGKLLMVAVMEAESK